MSNNQLQEKIYILEGLGCANCAAKMEEQIQQLPKVESATLTFATKQLKITAKDPAATEDTIQHICQTIEPEVFLVEKTSAPTGSYENKNGIFNQHKTEIITLIIGAILFALGVVGEFSEIINAAIFVIFAISYILLGHRVLRTAAGNIFRGQVFDENLLMSLATLAAFCIGEFAEGVGVMLFYRIGELFEHIAVEKSRSQIMEAVDMRPETVTLVVEESHEYEHDHDECCCKHKHHHENESVRIIPAGDAKAGDIILVRPGDRIPLDGIIIEGDSHIDTSPITGEPVPVRAYPGAEVASGCVNEQGVLKIRITHPLSESMVTKILNSVENAAAGKPKIDKFITRFAKVYTPIVVALAVLTAILPSVITGEWALWIKTAITFLVISCPCALVISVPLAFFAGIGAASKLGILFKGGSTLEALKNVKAIVMDKTGTITQGIFAVESISSFTDMTEEALLSLAASCESSSSHPAAASILEKAAELKLFVKKADSIEEFAGMGIKAELDVSDVEETLNNKTLSTTTVLCGNRKLMERHNIALPELPEPVGTEILIALDDSLVGQIIISDRLKDDSVSAILHLKSMGLVPAMLTGDNMESAAVIASISGISKVRAGLLPEDKVKALGELRDELGPVMFVGDGINDSPVLAGTDVGAAMGSGADAAIEAADVVFMNSSLESIPQSIHIAKRVGRIASQNIIFALGVKFLVILFGIAGFANIWAAVFADTGVAMLCILNSLKLFAPNHHS